MPRLTKKLFNTYLNREVETVAEWRTNEERQKQADYYLNQGIIVNDIEYVKFALEINPQLDLNKLDNYNRTYLDDVISRYNPSYFIDNSTIILYKLNIMKYFIKEGVSTRSYPELIDRIIRNGDYEFLEWLLKVRPEINLNENYNDKSFLNHAANVQQREIFLLLYDKNKQHSKEDIEYYKFLMFMKEASIHPSCPKTSKMIEPVSLLLSNTYSEVVRIEVIKGCYKALLSENDLVSKIFYTAAISSTFQRYTAVIHQEPCYAIELYKENRELLPQNSTHQTKGHFHLHQKRIVTEGNDVDKVHVPYLVHEVSHVLMDILFDSFYLCGEIMTCHLPLAMPYDYRNDTQKDAYHTAIRKTLENINTHFTTISSELNVDMPQTKSTFSIGKELYQNFFTYILLKGFRLASIKVGREKLEESKQELIQKSQLLNNISLNKPKDNSDSSLFSNIKNFIKTLFGTNNDNAGTEKVDIEKANLMLQIHALIQEYDKQISDLSQQEKVFQEFECTEKSIQIFLTIYSAYNEWAEDAEFIVRLPEAIASKCYDSHVQGLLKPLSDYWYQVVDPKMNSYLALHDPSRYCVASDNDIFV